MATSVFELEKKMIPFRDWEQHLDKFPPEQQKWIRDCIADPYAAGPMGIGYTEETGYYILFCGQGPGVGWMEKDVKIAGIYN